MPTPDTAFLDRACQLAAEGMKHGHGGPFGAVIVRSGVIIGEGWNRVLASNDPTAHAEIVAIRNACTREKSYWLEGSRLYVSCEPCPMCLAAAYWARIEKIVFAASHKDAAAIGFDDARIYREIRLPMEQRAVPMVQGEKEKALQVMRLWPGLCKSY